MHRFEWCQSTESMIGDQGGSRKSCLKPGTVLGTKSVKKVKRCFSRRVSLCLPLPVDKNTKKVNYSNLKVRYLLKNPHEFTTIKF